MRLTLALLTILGTVCCSADAEACWLSDRLFGRGPQYVASYAPYGYVASYAPATTTPYVATYAPAATPQVCAPAPAPAVAAKPTTTPVTSSQPVASYRPAANYQQAPATTYAVAYPPAAAPAPAAQVQAVAPAQPVVPVIVARPTWGMFPGLAASGAYQVQRPAYIQNPSVYTGLPVNARQSYVPIRDTLRGIQPRPVYLGAGNQYPDSYQTAYVAAYPGAVVPTAPVTTGAATPIAPPAVTTPPPTTVPAPAVSAPVTTIQTTAVPAQQPAVLVPAPRRCGLARFFGSLWGTNYETTYYRAPVTYYRPVTAIDPVSGVAVTSQQACTSFEQQLQRTPYASPQLTPTSPPAAASACETYGAQPPCSTPQTWPTAPPSGVGQVGGVSPISPPTMAPTSPSNLSPLTGPAPLSGAPATGDLAPVAQPQLNGGAPAAPSVDSRRESTDPAPTTQPEQQEEEDTKPNSFWQLQNPADSTAMIRRPSTETRETSSNPFNSQPAAATPIQAPNDYVAPFSKSQTAAPTTSQSIVQPKPTLQAPPLPPRTKTYAPSEFTRSYDRDTIQVREAALVRSRNVQPTPAPRRTRVAPQPVKRDTTWYTIKP